MTSLEKISYYSGIFSVITTQEPKYQRVKRYNHDLCVTHEFVTTVYNERTKEVLEIKTSVTLDGAQDNYNELKTKYIFDYGKILTPAASEESKDKGSYDFGKIRSRLSGWRS